MMAILATVGLSIVDNLTEKVNDERWKADPDKVRRYVPKALERFDFAQWWAALVDHVKQYDTYPVDHMAKIDPGNREWKSAVSAEFDSISLFCKESLADTKVYLLASDTAEGLAAAYTNAALLGGSLGVQFGPWNNRITVRNTETVNLKASTRVRQTEVHRISGLDPIGNLRAGLGEIVETLAGLATGSQAEKVHVCLSGGYKAQIPSLITACEELKRLEKISGAFLNTLDSQNVSKLVPIRLRPVREIPNLEARMQSRDPELLDYAFDSVGPTEVGLVLQAALRIAQRPGSGRVVPG
jgi:hypothetical protein